MSQSVWVGQIRQQQRVYYVGQINVVKGCVSRGFNHATFDNVFFASRVV